MKNFKLNKIKIGLLVAVCMIGAAQFFYQQGESRKQQQEVVEKTKLTEERMKLIGKRLIDAKFERKIFIESATDTQNRGLASDSETETGINFQMKVVEEGQTGRDAWGAPIHYKKTDTQLIIWSNGPHYKADSKEPTEADIQVKIAL